MPSRGHAKPRRGISVSSRWGRAPTRGSRAWGPGWGPSASELMKTNGSVYVAVVLAVLAGYFTYQWWFNPSRAIKRQLGELAATLSVPAENRGETDRLARVARLRNYFAPDVRVTLGGAAPVLTSWDALLGAASAWNPPPGDWIVSFVDVQIAIDTESTARAYMTVEVESRDPSTGQPALDSREMLVGLAKRDGVWVITTAEPMETVQRP